MVWGGKQARVSWSTLTLDYNKGGFNATDFYIYYLSAQAQHVYFWYKPHEYTPHVAVEHSDSHPIQLHSIITHINRHIPKTEINTIDATITAWQAIGQQVNKLPIFAPAMPLEHHAALSVTHEVGVARLLREAGMQTMQDLYPDGVFHTTKTLQYITNPTLLFRFVFHKLRQAIKSHYKTYPAAPATLHALQLVMTTPTKKKVITKLYKIIRD